MNNQGAFSVNDFYSGHDFNTPARSILWNMVIDRSYASWECAADKYEKDGPKGLSGRGMRGVLKFLINPKDLDEEVHMRYGRRKDLTYEQKQEMLLKTLGGTLANQLKSKFPQIYNYSTGKRIYHNESLPLLKEINKDLKDEFKGLNETFKTNSTKYGVSDKLPKTKLLPIAVKINELLEPLSEKEREYVLNV